MAGSLSSRSLPTFVVARGLIACGIGLVCLGCFDQPYTDRMKTTIELYDHIDTLNRNLGTPVNISGFEFRPPFGFELIPPPEIPAPEPGKENAPPPDPASIDDPRQPEYLGIKLPGLIAAWKKKVQIDSPPEDREAFIYLLSNREYWTMPEGTPGRISPPEFSKEVVNRIARDMEVVFEEKDWFREDVPKGTKLVQKVTYDALQLVPKKTIAEVPTKFQIYLTSQGDNQGLILIVSPDSISAGEKLQERIPLSLETLRIPADKGGGGVTTSGTGAGSPQF